jgi:branched-chain amino acid transport system permease protein
VTWDVALILGIDGIANGAIYLLAGLGLVLIFSVTRVVFVPFGDVAAFAALSLAAFELGRLPPTVGLVAMLALLAVAAEVWRLVRRGESARVPRAVLGWGVLPLLPCALAWGCWSMFGGDNKMPHALAIVLAIALVVPITPLVARVALQPIADASVLVLLIAALALHFLLSGLGLLFFGPEGFRTAPLASGSITLPGGFPVSGQVVLMLASAVVLSGLFFLAFERTVAGKALRATAVNRVGARLVGIRPARTALLAYTFASLLAGLIGVLVAPITTMYYDSGFLIGLKAFVAAIIGGLVSYPLTALGALAVGVVESFGSFWHGALKDVIVFSLLIPVLLLRSALARHAEEEQEEIEA